VKVIIENHRIILTPPEKLVAEDEGNEENGDE